MEQLQIEMKTYYSDDKPPKVETISLWHGKKPFVFADDNTVKYVVVANIKCYTQEAYDAFFYGVQHVRNILVSLVNK